MASQTFELTGVDVFVDSVDEIWDLVIVSRRREVAEVHRLGSVRDSRHQPQAADNTIRLLS